MSNFDKYDEIYQRQKELMDYLAQKREWYRNANVFEKIRVTILSIIDELMELLHELPWKPWKNLFELNREKVIEEFADLLHFVIQLQILLGISPEVAYKYYIKKREVNFKRQKEVEGYKVDEE